MRARASARGRPREADPVVVHPAEGLLGDHPAEEDPQHRVASDPPESSGHLVAAAACAPRDDLLDALPAALLVGGERRLDRRRPVQLPGQGDRVLDRHRRTLPRGRGGSVRGVADDDHRAPVPDRDMAQVMRVVGGQLELAGLDQLDRRAGVSGEEVGELSPPGGLARRGALVRRDLWARHVGEPHDVAVRRRLVPEERLPPEDRCHASGSMPSAAPRVTPPKFVSPT